MRYRELRSMTERYDQRDFLQSDAQAFDALPPERQREIQDAENELCAVKEQLEIAFAHDAQARAELERKRERRRRLHAAGCEVPDHMLEAIGADMLPSTPALEACKLWLAQPSKPWLVLASGVGAGKSIAAAYAVSQHDGVAIWATANEMARVFASAFSDMVERAEAACKSALLVVDDVGTELDAGRLSTALVELLNARQSERRVTIVTTNLAPKAFAERYPDPRLHSRVAEAVEWTTCVGPDLRRGLK